MRYSLNNLNKCIEEININFLADTMKELGQYRVLISNIASELARVEETRKHLQEQIDHLQDECDSLVHSIQGYKKQGKDRLVKSFEKNHDKVAVITKGYCN